MKTIKISAACAAVMMLALAASARDRDDNRGKMSNADRKPASAETTAVDALVMGNELAAWARETHNPLALALAGSMVDSVKTSPMSPAPKKTEEGEGGGSDARKAASATDGAALVAEARQMAGEDAATLSAIDRVVASVPKAKGDVTGPNDHDDCVHAGYTDRYRIVMRAGENATVYVSGDGDTDLDLYVYDENGNLIGSDTDYSDQCVVTFFPAWTGPFTIAIRNLGSVMNCYTLYTN